MPVAIAELFVTVGADVSAATSQLRSLNTQVSNTAQTFNDARPAALALAGTGAAVAAGFAVSVNTAADFEKQMSGIKAVMNPAEISQFGTALEDLALTLGRDTQFSASQAAAGIEELIKAGVPAESVMAGAGKAAIDLAAATGITVAEAATIASQALNVFGLDAGNLTPTVDRLAAVANASASDISFLRFGLAASGGVAKTVGLSFEDTAVALGLLSNRFASGSDAGTSFKTFLNGLIPQTKKDFKAFRELGFITEETSNIFFDQEGKMKSLAEIAGILKDALGGLSEEERNLKLLEIFGTDAQRAAAAFVDIGKGGVESFVEQTGQAGAAAASASTRTDNFQGAMERLGGSIEDVQISLGKLLLPDLRRLVEFVEAGIERFGTLSPEMQKLSVVVIGVAGALAGLLGTLILLAPFISSIVPAVKAMAIIFGLIVSPVGLVVLAITGLIAAFAFFFTTNEDFRAAVLGTVDSVLKLAASVGEGLQPFLEAVGRNFATLGPLFESVGRFFEAFRDTMATLGTVGGSALQGLFENVLIPGFEALRSKLVELGPFLEPITQGIANMAGPVKSLGDQFAPLREFFDNATAALLAFKGAVDNFQLPEFLRPGSGFSLFGAAPAPGAQGTTGATVQPAAFNPNQQFGSTGPLISIGMINISSEAEAQAFMAQMAAVILDATRRAVPPVPLGTPGTLATEFS